MKYVQLVKTCIVKNNTEEELITVVLEGLLC